MVLNGDSMIKQTIRRFRVETVLNEILSCGGAYWWTLTTADVVDYREISRRWKNVRHWLNEKYVGFRYVQNFEIHPKGHGWHIHFICNCFVNLKRDLMKIRSFGFGRVSCSRVWSSGISDYLVKHAFKPIKGNHRDSSVSRVRLINVSRSCCAPLKRFQVCGGNTGLISPSKKDGSFRAQIVGKMYGLPVLPRSRLVFNPFEVDSQLEFDLENC